AQRHVAQRWHLEGSAQVGPGCQVAAFAGAEPEVGMCRIGIGDKLRIAWDAEGVVGEVGEEGMGAVPASRRRMAGTAVAFQRVFKRGEPSRLGGAEGRLAVQERVELAGE